MEQHNIDSRFKNSLGNLERQPSADAWARLQSRMAAAEPEPIVLAEKPAEKKKTAWWLSIAAAVVLLLASVAVFRGLHETNPNQPELATATTKTVPSEKVKPAMVTKVVSPDKAEIAMVSAPKSNAAATAEAVSAKTLKAEVVKSQPAATAEQISTPVIARNEPKPAPATQPTKTLASGTEKPEPQLAYQAPEKGVANPDPASDLAGKPIEVIVKFEKNEPAQSSAVAAATPQTPSTGKSTLLQNIFKQTKNLKNGEGVNLAEIGLIQDAKVAIGNRNLPGKFSKVFQN